MRIWRKKPLISAALGTNLARIWCTVRRLPNSAPIFSRKPCTMDVPSPSLQTRPNAWAAWRAILHRAANGSCPSDGHPPHGQNDKSAALSLSRPQNPYCWLAVPTGRECRPTIRLFRRANQSGGVFYLRIEDTDEKREVPGAVEEIINGLRPFFTSSLAYT